MTTPSLPPAGSTGWNTEWAAWVHTQVSKIAARLKPSDLDATGTPSSSTWLRGDGVWASITKAVVGLSNVDNTADSAKPVSTAQATAINAKATASLVEGLKTHDGTAGGGVRPSGFFRVRWIGGTTRPTNMLAQDIWERDA